VHNQISIMREIKGYGPISGPDHR